MSPSRTLSVGMDVPQDTIAVASGAKEHDAAVVSRGPFGPRQCDIDTLIWQRQSQANHRVCVSAAGPCGEWLERSLTQQAAGGWVVAPSWMPPRAGDRGTTARRDARPLARRRRAGALTPVSGPAVDAAALRALRRARAETRRDLQAAQVRRTACLLRPASRSTGRAPWSPAPLRWRSAGIWPTPAQPSVLQAYGQTVTDQTERLGRLARALHAPGQPWRFQPVVEARQAWRGVPCTVAVPTVAAWGALTRFATPRPRLPARGRTPSASARGARRQPGSMTTTGKPHARRAVGEGAGAYR
jgi:transposase